MACERNEEPSAEQCDDGLDNDCDGLTDAADEEDCGSCESGAVDPAAPIQEQWLRVCPGEFDMGSPEDEPLREPWEAGNETQHRVELTGPFLIQATEVTVAQWRECFDAEGCPEPDYHHSSCNELDEAGKDSHPVNCVRWYEVVAYSNWLSQTAEPALEACYLDPDDATPYDRDDAAAEKTPVWSGEPGELDCPGFRLPTEGEWEYAARAGSSGMFSNCGPQGEADACDASNLATCVALNPDLAEVAVYCANDPGGTAEVGSKAPNAWGLHDALGNVWEWVWDLYATDYGGHDGLGGVVTDPPGPDAGGDRVIRGGSWTFNARDCRAANRHRNPPGGRSGSLGFRPARSVFP